MNKRQLLEKSREALDRDAQLPPAQRWQRLLDKGIIDEQGRLRDKVRFWHAYLAVVAVKPSSGGDRIDYFRCLKPAFGWPGEATIDVSRDRLAQYVAESKRIITAFRCANGNWKEGEEIHLTSAGYLRTDANEDEQDNLGELPEFKTVRSGL